jgi:hypothetical protein
MKKIVRLTESSLKRVIKKILNEEEINFPSSDFSYDHIGTSGTKDEWKRNIKKELTPSWENFKSRRENDLKNWELLKKGAKVYYFDGTLNRGKIDSGLSPRTVIAFNLDEAIKKIKQDSANEMLRYQDINPEDYGKEKMKFYKTISIDPSDIENITSKYSRDLLNKINGHGSAGNDFIEDISITEPYDDYYDY